MLGKYIRKKPANTIWLIFQNVDGIPRGEAGEWKLKVMQQFLMELQADIFGFTYLLGCDTIPGAVTHPHKRQVGDSSLELRIQQVRKTFRGIPAWGDRDSGHESTCTLGT